MEEKVNITVGVSPSPNGCVGLSGAAASIGFPGLCLQDGPTGVRGTDFVTSFPAELHLGASWNTDLAHEVAEHMGLEFRRKGGEQYLHYMAEHSLTGHSQCCTWSSCRSSGTHSSGRTQLGGLLERS